jgi:hypothetical protein
MSGQGVLSEAERWFRSVHESGHFVMCEHLDYEVVFAAIGATEERSGATVSIPSERPTEYQEQIRVLGGLAAELLVFGTRDDGTIETIAWGDLEKLELQGKPILKLPTFQHAFRILKRKKARLLRIASALMKYGAIDAKLNSLSAKDMQKIENGLGVFEINGQYRPISALRELGWMPVLGQPTSVAQKEAA